MGKSSKLEAKAYPAQVGTAQQASWHASSEGALAGSPTSVPTRSMLAWVRNDARLHSGVSVGEDVAVGVPV